MNKRIIHTITAAILLSGTTLSANADTVDVQSRVALANCMIESAVAIAAAMVTENGCQAGEWALDTTINEWINAKIPIQGALFVSDDEDFYELNGKMSARRGQSNDVSCAVQTVSDTVFFAGNEFVYSAGKGNLYPEALPSPTATVLTIDTFESAGSIKITSQPRVKLLEEDQLDFSGTTPGLLTATGSLNILSGNGRQTLSNWDVSQWDEEVPALNAEPGTFNATFTTGDIGGCTISVDAIVNIEDFSATINGTLTVE